MVDPQLISKETAVDHLPLLLPSQSWAITKIREREMIAQRFGW